MSSRTDDRSVAELVGQASEQVSRLVRDEIRLATRELAEKGKRAGIGAGLFGGAGLFAFFGVAALITAAILALSLALAPWLAAVLVGLVLLLIAGVVSLLGKKQIDAATPPIPQEAAKNVKTDIAAVKEGLHR
ncbi:phage holin family protein [Kibdelosporangium persicum]|uniref:Holin-X, holin superfamily III n=1 Tax=Kibdelosporangium persicum TaxID=2698649 RepID=A0ABX2F1U3_9PSEU|nr:phage holin family protein [Kibdelosporangium persicum]NRN65197.1 Holin-X, holin superfamily III [Kibdelosporangium persicum]